MRITLLICVPKAGVGGHYHSLCATAEALASAGHDINVISIGYQQSPVVSKLSERISRQHIQLSWPLALLPLRRCTAAIRITMPDVIHAFDVYAYLFARIAATKLRIPAILTKCGGPKPRTHFPRGEQLIVYSGEDFRYFSGKWNNIHLLPNRVTPFAFDTTLMQRLEACLPHTYTLRLLRISRIGNYYEKTLRDTMRLLDILRSKNIDACLLIVGAIYEGSAFARLRSVASEHVFFITDQEFTQDAKRVLGVADIVVGTGRSLMEAAVAGRAVLAPLRNLDIPILITRDNVDVFLDKNFSERTIFVKKQEDAIDEIAALGDLQVLRAAQDDCQAIANRYFLVSEALPAMESIYSNAETPNHRQMLDTALHVAEYCYRLSKAWIRRKVEAL
ncbi:glycosyltransferase [Sphingosinicella xenopeptidilytica]|uniref:Glycosyltransferase n=1 Tax=Sphingosinicella xenopeptidilytica TaxID=364098 RepID=A0ABW3C1Q2_SPHXN